MVATSEGAHPPATATVARVDGPDGIAPGGMAGPFGAGGGPTDPGRDEAPTPAYEPMSVKGPALIVLGLAVVILLGGVAAAALSSTTNPTFSVKLVTLGDGTTVDLVPATTRLGAIVSNGEPPTDIIGNLGIARESQVTGTVNSDQHTAQFDRTTSLTSQLAEGQVAEAYRLALEAAGWKVIYQGSAPQGAPGATEVLAKRGSSDGFYWETGVVVSPTLPTGSTPYTIEVLETPDGN